MYKGSVELGKINRAMKVKFNLIIQNDDVAKAYANQQEMKVIHEFLYNGSEYLRLNPHPFLTIDISKSSDKNDGWNANLMVNLSSKSLFIMKKRLKVMIDRFQVKNLFYKQNGRLCVNVEIANEFSQYVRLPNRTVKLIHTVVPDEENKEVEYEGIAFMINSVDNYCYLTYDELEYLYEVLSKINMEEMSIQIINTYLLRLIQKSLSETKDEPTVFTKSFSEVKETIPETPKYAKIEEGHEIPEI